MLKSNKFSGAHQRQRAKKRSVETMRAWIPKNVWCEKMQDIILRISSSSQLGELVPLPSPEGRRKRKLLVLSLRHPGYPKKGQGWIVELPQYGYMVLHSRNFRQTSCKNNKWQKFNWPSFIKLIVNPYLNSETVTFLEVSLISLVWMRQRNSDWKSGLWTLPGECPLQ